MDTLFNLPITEQVLVLHGYQKHQHYDYWYFAINGHEGAYRLEKNTYRNVWCVFLPCYHFPLVRELTTLGQLSNLHQGFYDKPIIE